MSMQSFVGNLASYRLPLLMPAFFQGGVSGTLRLCRGPVERTFSLEGGQLVAEASNDPHEHLAQALVDVGVLAPWAAVEAFHQAQARHQPYGAFLAEGPVPEPVVRQVLVQKAREALFDCYRWESGEVEWIADAPAATGCKLGLKLLPLHHDALAIWKEWKAFRELFPDPDTTFKVCSPRPSAWNAEELGVLMRAEACVPVSELVGTGADGLVKARLLERLYRRGVLQARPSLPQVSRLAEKVDRARQLLRDGDYERAASVAAEALRSAAVPEAQALYRNAASLLAQQVSDGLQSLEGRLEVRPMLGPPPQLLTMADLYWYSRLRASTRLLETLQSSSPSGVPQVLAFQSMKRLMALGLVRVKHAS
jgi:hypothetical protein